MPIIYLLQIKTAHGHANLYEMCLSGLSLFTFTFGIVSVASLLHSTASNRKCKWLRKLQYKCCQEAQSAKLATAISAAPAMMRMMMTTTTMMSICDVGASAIRQFIGTVYGAFVHDRAVQANACGYKLLSP